MIAMVLTTSMRRVVLARGRRPRTPTIPMAVDSGRVAYCGAWERRHADVGGPPSSGQERTQARSALRSSK